MAGFPTRPSANAFGPKMVDRGAVRDPRKEVDAARMNLMRWQIAGAGLTCARAWVLASWASGAIAITAHGSAWQGVAPTLSRSGTGVYVVTYAAAIADADGDMVAPDLLAAVVSPRAASPKLRGDWDISAGRIITVNLVDKDDVARDGSFLLLAF